MPDRLIRPIQNQLFNRYAPEPASRSGLRVIFVGYAPHTIIAYRCDERYAMRTLRGLGHYRLWV